jgi:hypothetical protein
VYASNQQVSWNNYCDVLRCIGMYWDDHTPSHFHAKYAEYEITVNITTGVIEGKFPKRALRHVLEWYELHKDELIEN